MDGSYLYRKYKALGDAGKHVSLPSIPPPPITGWTVMTSDNSQSLAPTIPPVTQGVFMCENKFVCVYLSAIQLHLLSWPHWTCR